MNNIIMHHGVEGQKHGQRRYQYPDGSLTPLGRIHYGIGQMRRNRRRQQTINAKRREKINNQKLSILKSKNAYMDEKNIRWQKKQEARKAKIERRQEIKRLKEERKMERAKNNDSLRKVQNKDDDTKSNFGFSSIDELYANRDKLTDSQLKKARERIENEDAIYRIKTGRENAAAAAAQAKKERRTAKTLGAIKYVVNNPASIAVGATMLNGTINAVAKSKNMDVSKINAAYNTIMSVLMGAAQVKSAVGGNKSKQKKTDNE